MKGEPHIDPNIVLEQLGFLLKMLKAGHIDLNYLLCYIEKAVACHEMQEAILDIKLAEQIGQPYAIN